MDNPIFGEKTMSEVTKLKLYQLQNCVNDIVTMDEIQSIILDSVSISSFTHLNDVNDLELFISRMISYISHKGGI